MLEHTMEVLPPRDPPTLLPALRDPAAVAEARVHVKLYPSPFRYEVQERWFPAGLSIDEGLAHVGMRRYRGCVTLVTLNEWIVPEPWFGLIRPKPYTTLTVRPVPRRSGIGRPLLMVAAAIVTVVAAVFGHYYVGPALFGQAATLLNAATGVALGTVASPGGAMRLGALPRRQALTE